MSAGSENSLDREDRADDIVAAINSKPSLHMLYMEFYRKFQAALARCPNQGTAIELGSGMGFANQVVTGLKTTDVIPYPGIDLVVDATNMPFADGELRGIFLLNVFHHIPDVGKFLAEATRCLMPGGRIYMIDQHHGIFSRWIYKYIHHEDYFPDAVEWKFSGTGPLSSANGALAWIVFRRDYTQFAAMFPKLKLLQYKPHTPLRYWLTGGLKKWTLLPKALFAFATTLDSLLIRISPDLASFVEIEIERV